MAQGQAKSRRTLLVALAVCVLVAACIAAARPIDTGNLHKSEMQQCDNFLSNLGFALNSDFLACHMCCAKKLKGRKVHLKGSEIRDDKCECVFREVKDEE